MESRTAARLVPRAVLARVILPLLALWAAGPLAAADAPAGTRCEPLGGGALRCTAPDGSREEFKLNSLGQRDGIVRRFDARGVLRSEAMLEAGTPVGPQKTFHDNGALERLQFVTGAKVQFSLVRLPDGRPTELRCAPVHLIPEDLDLCGHDGKPRQTTLQRDAARTLGTVTFQSGVLRELTVVGDNGAVIRSEAYEQKAGEPDRRIKRVYYPSGRLRSETVLIERPADTFEGREGTGREWADSGQLTQEVVWAQGREQRLRQWYLNGQLKLDQQIRRQGRHEERLTRSFWENGQPAAVNTERFGRLWGWQRYFGPKGQRLRDDEHGPGGELLRRRHYNAAGQVEREEVLADDARRL